MSRSLSADHTLRTDLWNSSLILTQRVQSQWDIKDSMTWLCAQWAASKVCPALLPERQFNCSHRMLWWSCKGKTCVPDGLFLNLQVHGIRNSMTQNITYNPIHQSPLFCFVFLAATTFTTNFIMEFTNSLKSRSITWRQPKMHFIFYLW